MRFWRRLHALPLRFRSIFRSGVVGKELDEELRNHIEYQTALNVERGMSVTDACRAALVALGGLEQTREAARDQCGVQSVDDDTRYGFRVLRRTRDSLGPLALGLLIGLPLAVATTRGASTLLFGLSPADVTTMVVASGVLAAAAGLAGSIPARRAARVNPGIRLLCD